MKIIGDILTSLFPIFRFDYRKQRMSFCFFIFTGCLFLSVSGLGQASISGHLTDVDTGESIFTGEVNVYQNDIFIASSPVDTNGNYSISNLDAGSYDIVLSEVGSIDVYILEIIVTDENCVNLDAEVYSHFALIQPTIINYQRPLIHQENFDKGQVFTSEQIRHLPNKN